MKIIIDTDNLSPACKDLLKTTIKDVLFKSYHRIKTDLIDYDQTTGAYTDMYKWSEAAHEQYCAIVDQFKNDG
jgi:hypothetical protein